MFQKKVFYANLVQMRKRAHHRELQLSNYYVCNFQFKTYLGSLVFFFFFGGGGVRLSARLHGFCRASFSKVYSLLVCFRRCFTLEQLSGNNQIDQKVINVSNRSVSCRKITQRGDKSFFGGNFSLCPVENLFSVRAGKKCPKDMPSKFHVCAIFYLEFFSKRRSLNDDGQTFFFPKVLP